MGAVEGIDEERTPLSPVASKIRTINRASYIDQSYMESRSLGQRFFLHWRRKFLRYYFVRPPRSRILWRAALSKDRMIPAFASIGAVRSGTSLFADYLMQHPCVVLPLAKELGLRTPTKRLVSAQFPTLREQSRIEAKYGAGRAITGYCAPMIPHLNFARIAVEIAPGLRFIIILRDPVDRTFAHWRWDQVLTARLRRDPLWRRSPDFAECVELELESMRCYGGGLATYSGTSAGGYIQHSIYLPFLKNLFRCFDRGKTLIINAQDFFADPPGIAKTAYQFLGLPAYEPVAMPVKNAGPAGAMSESVRQELRNFFRPLNQELYQFLGRDFGWQ
jgi:hypothetical protein